MHQGNGQVILPLKRQTPRQHLVEKHAHRVNICSAIEFLALCLFGRKVVDRAKHLAMACILLSFRMLLPLLIMWGISLLLVVFERDLGSALLFFVFFVIMLFVSTGRVSYVVVSFLLLAVGGAFCYRFFGHVQTRINIWLDPWSDAQGGGYQIVQSLYAIGSGGLMGLGLGRSRQKYLYLPEEHNDYIFPIVCEELGFVGAMVVLLLFLLLILRGYWIALHARDRFGMLVVGGLTTLLALQVFLNIGVVTNLLPATGISLPFFSYGGTALLIQLFEMGVILSVSRQNDNKLI